MKTLLMSCVATAALCSTALAQQDRDDGSVESPNVVLVAADLITVYATRNPISSFDYPGQVLVIDADIIEDFNPSTVADIFDAVPGASISGGPRRTGQTPEVRGLSGAGVLVLFDGARQSFLSGHDGRFFIDPYLINTIEVVRGPTSALYGSGALGGVIAIQTITAGDFLGEDETFGFKLGTGYQSVNEEWRANGTGAWRSDDEQFDIVGSMTWRQSEDIELGNGLALPADDELVSSLLKTTFRPSDDLTLSASWIHFGGESIDPNNPQGNNLPGSGNTEVFRDIDSDTFLGRVSYASSDSNLIDANLTAYFSSNSVKEDEVDSARVISREVETFGISFDNRSRFSFGGTDLTLTYGGEFYEDEQIGRDNTTADGTRGGVPDATGRFYGFFAQAELDVNEPLGAPGVMTIIPGIRWDKFKNEATGEASTEDNATSPKLGVSYKPIPELIFFGNWAQAFRAPSFNEIYADNLHFQIPNFAIFPPILVSNFFIPNTGLGSEESESWELGAGINLNDIFGESDQLTAKGSYYSANVSNLIDLEVNIPAGCFGAPFPPCGSGEPFGNFSRYVNVTNAEIEGFELEVAYDSEFFYTRANFSTIDGTDVDSDDYVGILSPRTVFIDSGIQWSSLDLRMGGRVLIAGDFDKVNDPLQERDGYAVGDIYLVWEPTDSMWDGFRLDLGVDNVTDADYEVVAAGVSQPGRNIKAAISWRQGF